jgi:cathepsin B
MRRALTSALVGGAAAGGTIKLNWSDCGDSSTHGKITSLAPTSVTLGTKTSLAGKGSIDEAIPAATYKVVAKEGPIPIFSHSGDACKPGTIKLPAGTGQIDMKGFKCPISPGNVELDLDLTLSSAIPAKLARVAIELTAQSSTGDKALCVKINTAPENWDDVEMKTEPYGSTQINDPDWIADLNSRNDMTWTAGHNDFFNGMTFDDARPLMGAILSDISEHLNNTLADAVYAAMEDAPASFDSITKWGDLIHPIRDQAHCGSCWAFSASEVLSDRVAIKEGKKSPVLSAEDMVSCDKSDMGCKGGRLGSAWSYLKNTGIVTDTCFPYGAAHWKETGVTPACRSSCADSEAWKKQKAASAYAIHGVTNMQKDIMTHGPIQVAFMVYNSFMSYKTGVYQKLRFEFMPKGGHAVKIIGWGTEKGTDYWHVANSWGTTKWGDQGFFKIKRGVNECGIETQGPPYAGLPAGSGSDASVVV